MSTEAEIARIARDEAVEVLIATSEEGLTFNCAFSRGDFGDVVATVYGEDGKEIGIVTLKITTEWGMR